jgi:hypothetical protein
MRSKLAALVCCATIGQAFLSACAVSPTPGGGYLISSPPVSSLFGHSDPGDGESSAASSAPGGLVTRGQPINFGGQLDGGKGTATLTPIGGNEYEINLQIIGYGSAGQIIGAGAVQGTLTRIGDAFTMSEGYDQRPPLSPCALNVTLHGSVLTVSEDYRRGGCSAFHGASVSFDGQLSAMQ